MKRSTIIDKTCAKAIKDIKTVATIAINQMYDIIKKESALKKEDAWSSATVEFYPRYSSKRESFLLFILPDSDNGGWPQDVQVPVEATRNIITAEETWTFEEKNITNSGPCGLVHDSLESMAGFMAKHIIYHCNKDAYTDRKIDGVPIELWWPLKTKIITAIRVKEHYFRGNRCNYLYAEHSNTLGEE